MMGFDVHSIFSLVVPVLVVLIAAYLAHLFTLSSMKQARRAEAVNDVLIEAYLAYEHASSRNYEANDYYRERENEWNTDLEIAVAKIQLLGPAKIADSLSDAINPNKEFKPGPQILLEIRNELRKQMGLRRAGLAPQSLRFETIKATDSP